METRITLAAHILLQLIHSMTGSALEGVRLSSTPTTPASSPPSHAVHYWTLTASPDLSTESSGGELGEADSTGSWVLYTWALLGSTQRPTETQVSAKAPFTVFPQTLLQETPAPIILSPSTQTEAAAAWQSQIAVTMNQVTSSPARTNTEEASGAVSSTSSSRKTQFTSRLSSPTEPSLPQPPASNPDHLAAIKASSEPPHTPSSQGSPPPNWANGRLDTSSGNPGQPVSPGTPVLYPPSPVDTSQTDRAQLARIWNAGEDDQWAAVGRRGGRGQGPPWAWTKGRRRRRKLFGDADVLPPYLSLAPSLSPYPVPLHSVAHKTEIMQEGDNGGANGRYEVLRPGGGHIDFKVTETGEFDGFSVTRTEEVEAPPSAADSEAYQDTGVDALDNDVKSGCQEPARDKGKEASGQEPFQGKTGRPPDSSSSSAIHSKDASPNVFLASTHATIHQDNNNKAMFAPSAIPGDIYSRELSQMKHELKPQQSPLAMPRAEGNALGVTTLSSLFNADLIPPLPDHWGRPWSRHGGLGSFLESPKPLRSVPEMDLHSATIPLPMSTKTQEKGTEWNHEWEETDESKTATSVPQIETPNTTTKDDSDEARRVLPHIRQNVTVTTVTGGGKGKPPLPVPPGPSSPQHETRRAVDMKHAEEAATHNTQATQPSIRKKEGVAASWPGAGERVEFVTVVPGGSWDVWGGPSIWDTITSTGNRSLRGSPVYSVYWGDTGGPGSPAGWPEGVWVIRGGSLAAIMALVATISVQVTRDGPTRRTSTPDSPQRVLHGQHATLATNLATSLASAHVLLIFGIQATGRAWVCGVVGLLLHFLHLVSCFWLLALTIRLLGSLLQRPAIHTALYCASAWGVSLGLVVVSYVVNPEGYETRRYCWMSVERGMLVSFIVPVCSLILVNAGLCLAAQKLLLDMRDGVKHEVMSVYKRDLRGAVCLLPLEGVSWFLAVVALEDHQSLALDCAAALVSACLGWLILYFHGWSWRCYGICWLRQRLHSTSSTSSRRMDDFTLPLTARYDHDFANQPLLNPLPPPPPTPLSTQGSTVSVTPTPCPPSTSSSVTPLLPPPTPPPPPPPPPPPTRTEEFPLQPIFPGHDRREVY